MHRESVVADPLRGQARGFSGTDVPPMCEKDRRPRSPRLGSIVNRQAALEASIATGTRLAPQVTSQRGVVADRRRYRFLAHQRSRLREVAAIVNAWLDIHLLRSQPMLSKELPIESINDGRPKSGIH